MHELFYPSNILTIARLLMLPPTLAYLHRPDSRHKALLCIGAAMLTDVIDGQLARQRNEVSRLGTILDPVSDKVTLNAIALMLSLKHGLPWWITSLFLARDVGILLAALLLYRHTSAFPTAQAAGKATTVALTLALLLYIADGPRSGKPAMYGALALGVLSVGQYTRHFLWRGREEQGKP